MSEQPDVRWAPMEPKPRRAGRIWLIVGLSVAAVVIVAVVLFFLLPRDGGTAPGPEGTPTSEQTTAPEGADPSGTPVATPPPVTEPTDEVFRGQVQEWLESSSTGLEIVSETSGTEALSVIDTLQADAQRLAELTAPSSVQPRWGDTLTDYATRLADLRIAATAGDDTSSLVTEAETSLRALRDIVGL